tara:strand:+ start:1003 stop:1485 length:483 start_codon:yes stop_codon:yes gene_type:complete
MPVAQSFNKILLTTSNNAENNILLSEINGSLNVDSNPVAISGSFGAQDLSNFDFNGNAILGFDASVVDSTSTTYTLSSSDSGKLISIEHSSTITITIPLGLGVGFNCSFLQKGAGSLDFSASNGVTLNNRQSYTKTAGQYAMATVVAYEENKLVLTGDLF